MVVLSLIVSIYYNVIMAYSIFYVGASFYGVTGDLPWTYCGKFYFETIFSFIPFFAFGLSSLLATKIRKYYVIFVYILQGKMGKMEKKSHN